MQLNEIEKAEAEDALISEFWLPQLQAAGARDKAGTANGFFFAAKGGHNAESHNHNDLGTCVMYFNGKPCLVDIGRETYTAKTFSNRRYEIWTMQSQYHNLPKINGVDQHEGREFIATNSTFKADAKKAVFSTDIAKAYPEIANVKKWIRTYSLERGKNFTIQDNWELSKVINVSSILNFVTACKVSEKAFGILIFEGEGFTTEMKYNSKSVSPKIEVTQITDSGLKRYWDTITRIVLELRNPGLKGQNKIEITQVK